MTTPQIVPTDEEVARFLSWRGVETPCPKCHGAGGRMYPSTSTWRGGVGGQSFTRGVCDACWGSGDALEPWANLRDLTRELDALRRAKGASTK